jgi:hypothetical protein
MSTLKVNNIIPFSGQTVNIQGDFLPSGSNSTQSLGSVSNPWSELYVSTGSVNFVAPGTPSISVAKIKAGGEVNAGVGPIQGMIFTETNNLRGSFSVGRNNIASGTASLANGFANTASGDFSHAEGYDTIASGFYSHTEGLETIANASNAHAEGQYTTASGAYAHAEGFTTTALGQGAHAEGRLTLASAQASHAEGQSTTASGAWSHAEGDLSTAGNTGAHAEGYNTKALGAYSHAENNQTLASGDFSHAGGYFSTASGYASFAHGQFVQASSSYQVVFGNYNALGNTSSLFVVGTGTSGTRKDGFSVEIDGLAAHIVIPTNSSNPGNPKAGSMYFNASTNLLFIHNGTAWRSASFA